MNIGKKIYREHTVKNSMEWAKQHIQDAPDGAVFLADVLLSAQGRQGRTWQVSTGQLLVTFVLKPPQLATIPLDDFTIRLNQLTMALSLGILAPLKDYGVCLKWPNDFMVQGKKMGGMLVHTVWSSEHPFGLIVGFGLNINNEFAENDDLHSIATSLKTVTNSTIQLRPLYKHIIAELNFWYDLWQKNEFTLIYKSWKEALLPFLNNQVTIHQKDGSLLTGKAFQVLPNGDLLLLNAAQKSVTVSYHQVETITLS